MTNMPILFFIIDGLGDRPVSLLGGKTPLEAATTPNLDKLAMGGRQGLVQICEREKNDYTSSGSGHLTLFGYSREEFPERGIVEALGLEIPITPGALYLRANFATYEDGLIIDRRAGRITENTAALCQAISFNDGQYHFTVYPSLEHRAVLEIKGPQLSSKIGGNDSKEENVAPLAIKAEDSSPAAQETATVLGNYLDKVHTILENHPFNADLEARGQKKANYLLVRGPGLSKAVKSFKEKTGLRAAAIAGGKFYRGVALFLGMDLLPVIGATGDFRTDLAAKFMATKKALTQYDFVFLHVKAIDEFGHDGQCQAKKEFVEKIDSFLPQLGDLSSVVAVITADHATPCEVKDHTSDPVPFLMLANNKSDNLERFNEVTSSKGSLGILKGSDVLPLVLKEAGR
ncbi:MAG: alkaline phosphatase family protein [bacterium]|nr:alkaline phosphatase family protein [bacterium]